MDKLCCILDADESYAVRISQCINSRHALPFEARAFSDAEAYYECEHTNEVELLIVGESMYPKVRDCAARKIIRLSEQSVLMEGDDALCIAKYQPCDNIIRDVINLYGDKMPIVRAVSDSRGKLVSIYSPNGCCGRTTLGLALAHIRGQRQRVLYINLEEFSALELPERRGSLSDALYYYLTGGGNARTRIMTVISQGNGFDYIPPAVCAQDLPQFSTESIMGLIGQLTELGGYELIIVDVGSLIKEPWRLLTDSDVILSPSPDTVHRRKKQSEFEKYLYSAGMEKIADRIVKVDIIRDNNLFSDGRINYPYLLNSPYGRMVSGIDV